MKNKKLCKIILISTVVGMLIMGLTIIFMDKSEIEIEDLVGNRSEMEDMNFIIQQKKGCYQTDSIIVSKDSETIKKRVKQGTYNTNLRKVDIENREVLEYTHDKNDIFENEEEIGRATVSNMYYEDNTYQLEASIAIKNKENNEIKEYGIPLEERGKASRSDRYISVPIQKDKNIIYLSVISEVYNTENSDQTTKLSLYKLNLVENKSKLILSKDYEENELNINSDYMYFGFSNNSKSYFLVNKKNEKTGKLNAQLLEFDVISKKINYIDLGDLSFNIYSYYKDEDNILLISDIENRGKDVESYLVDLKNRKVKYKQKLELGYNGNEIGIVNSRRQNGKIYIITEEYTSGEHRLYKSYYMHVIEEKTNKTLYKGKIKLINQEAVTAGIVKKNEL